MILPFLSSGLFLGWSLGANDAANVFGSAVGSKMIKFRTAAILCGLFVIIGSIASGAGTTETIGKLGAVDALAGAFAVAFAAAVAVFWMTRLKLPVSTSQAIVGGIIGWNLFSGNQTDITSLTKILSTWVICPIISAVFAAVFFLLYRKFINRAKIHLLTLDSTTRWGLISVGIFGSYALGANNIANVMGVFVPVAPFKDINLFGLFTIGNQEQLFFIGGLAIAAGVATYSRRVMDTVGGDLMRLSPQMALIVVLSHSLVLFLFSSQWLESLLHGRGLPAIPLVPVSSSQAIVGAIIGIGLVKGRRTINYGTFGKIASGWVITPIIAAALAFISLFIVQNVFDQNVYASTDNNQEEVNAKIE